MLGLSVLHSVSAKPIDQQAPEIIPGPGMPSLESLGVTSAELYAKGRPKLEGQRDGFNDSMHVLASGGCGPRDENYADVNGLIFCYNYLVMLDTYPCSVEDGNWKNFCGDSGFVVGGHSETGRPTSSFCGHVAMGLLWIIDSCTRPQQDCAGGFS